MIRNADRHGRRWRWIHLLATCCMTLSCLTPLKFAGAAQTNAGEYQLEKVVMLLRHGVRSGFHPDRDAAYSGKPWPAFGNADGQLTEHGRDALVVWGAYHRTLLNQAGLFSVNQVLSSDDVLVETSPKQRTRESADAFLAGLSPGFVVPPSSAETHRRFVPHDFDQSIPDPVKGRAAAMAALGMSLSAAQAHYRPELLAIERALSIPEGCFADQPWRVEAADGIRFQPLSTVEDMLETVRMQYANGMPIENVAFGNVSDAQALTTLMGIRTLYWEMVHFPRYVALHLYAPLFAAMSHTLLDDATGPAGPSLDAEQGRASSGPKLAVYVGHDSNVAPISAILGFKWQLPGGLLNDQQPGGFIMFERLREVKTGARFVRVSYHAQTLDQLRHVSALGAASSDTAPSAAPSVSSASLAPIFHIDPLSVPFRADFQAPAAWGTRANQLIPLAQYQAMVQGVAAEALSEGQPAPAR